MGARTLRSYIEQPLLDKAMITQRFDAIECLNNSMVSRDELREYLGPIYDLERLVSKINFKTVIKSVKPLIFIILCMDKI